MKDMSTTDKTVSESSSTENSPKNTHAFAKFAGKQQDDDDWGEFAEEDEEEEKKKEEPKQDDKPKYTFGASSGFGSKGWATTHQTVPVKSTLGGFGNFGGFKKEAQEKEPSFSAFAKTTVSPFANVAAAVNVNALSTDKPQTQEEEGSTGFGGSVKTKVPGVKPTEVKTGEEDEQTIYQTKAKLLVLDNNNWKERGVGTFRINMKEDKARLVMRTDSVYRLILNLGLFKGMKVCMMQDKFVRFAGFETETKEDGTTDTKLVSFALKLSNAGVAKETCDQITACLPE
ncbi:uncharacterized protein B0P05DRAFT_240042 [Gilbertella persicaria]|uniref:uncharacterized protein n=1 Tax=Gilbertella persicaria TaxID=101096 RepID=UPI00221EC5E8|nr:uncharacterized protein B0P05DRAFT_240042 [Gilbertella persicaria]KAI8063421.1 hypothetical protein B0P05DRAFT_240042 [Gilbertella persicaria]